VQLDAGYARSLFSDPKHRLWAQVGGAVIYSDYRSIKYQPFKTPDPSRDDPEFLPFGRLFVGYENQLNELVQFKGGVEGLLNITKPGASRGTADAAVVSSLSDNLKLELKGRVLADFDPVVEGAQKFDFIGNASLIYTVL
jgi:hypothetical protein